MNGLRRGGALLDKEFDRFYASEGYQSDPADWGQDWDDLIGGWRGDKTPQDLRDFSIVKAVKFNDGIHRKIRCQKAAPLMMSASETGRKRYNAMWDHLEGGRKIPGLKY